VKVALDISPLKGGHRYRGIGAYTQNLSQALKKLKKKDFQLQLIANGFIPKDCDLIHHPFFDLFFQTLPLRKKKPTVVTIHDVIPLVFPQHFPIGIKGYLKLQIQKISLKGVKAVITDSENSRRDIFKYLKYPQEKIYVVPLAAGESFKLIKDKNPLLKIKQKFNLPERFILYVGDVNYNKNILGLVKAFAKINSQELDLKLVLVGKAFADKQLKETKQISQLVKRLKLAKKVIFLDWIAPEDLVAVYNLATVYCQPSFYEGFGLPVLEAMACGCPVVAAQTSSLPEICGQAAVMFNPRNTESMRKAIKKAMEKKMELIQRGLKQAKKFSWAKTAQKTYEVYQKVV